MNFSKKNARIRRATKFRAQHKNSNLHRLCVNRTIKHIYAQIFSLCGTKTIAAASSINLKNANGNNIQTAKEVGKLIAKAAIDKEITKLAFDRSGFKYHGRIKALADSARAAGLEF